ncbi:MAG: amidohydrolase family protein [Acidimicrobiales bacterium]
MLLQGGLLADGRQVDVRITGETIAEVAPGLQAGAGEPTVALNGRLLLPAACEPHAHLDKALTADRVVNRTGDLMGAVEAWRAYWPQLTVDDIAARGEQAARRLLAAGCTVIRTHADVSALVGTGAVEGLARVRERLRGLVEIEIVALTAPGQDDREEADNQAALRDALDAGADVVGGCPHLSPHPLRHLHACAELAAERGRALDLHTDETLDPKHLELRDLAAWVHRTGFAHPVAASHCVSLGMQAHDVQDAVAEEVAAAGVAVITLPQTNLFLQAREHRVGPPRGLTALGPLLRAGVVVGAGADNLQDPFNTVGRADPFETAALLVMAGHLLPEQAYEAVSGAARRATGRPAVTIEPGSPAELLAVPAPTVRAAVADGPAGRIVIHRGRVVAGGETDP